MEKAAIRYWNAYEKAVDMQIESIMKKISLFDISDDESFRRLVQSRFNKAFHYIDEHRDSFKVIAVMIENTDFNSCPTNEIYDLYCHCCEPFGFNVIAKEHFARFVCKYFGYMVIDKRLKRLKGSKCRVFIKTQ